MRTTSLLPPALLDAPIAFAAVSQSGRVRQANRAFSSLRRRLHLSARAWAQAWRACLGRAPTVQRLGPALLLARWPLERPGRHRPCWLVSLEALGTPGTVRTARRSAGRPSRRTQGRAGRALRQSDARYRSVFEHSLEGVLLTRPTGETLAANPAACRMLGRTEEEVCAAGRAGLIAPEDGRLAGLLEQRRRTGEFRGELSMVRNDGTRFPADVSSRLFRDGSGQEVTCLLFRDLTEQKRAQASLEFLVHAGEELGRSLDYEQTLAALTHLVVPAMADLCMVDLVEGDKTRRVAISHRDPAQVAKLKDRQFDLAREDPGVGIARVLRTGKPELVREVDRRWLRQAIRDTFHVQAAQEVDPRSVMHVPLIEEHGRPLGVLTLAVVADNPRRFTEADLPLALGLADRAAQAIHHARLFAAAVEARKLRDEVLAVVSHDLRNPLYTISLCTDLLARQRKSPQLDLIRTSVLRADRLIEDLLVASALDRGAIPLDRDLESVAVLVEETLALHRAQAEDRQIDLSARVEPDLPLALLDRHRVLQLLGNLVGNALKFTPRGGWIRISARRDGGALQLAVRDNGPGIPPEDLPHLFNRFWQGAHGRRAGVGLGLAIAKGIADSHGGSLRVESTPGEGARFVITLPLGTPAEQAEHLS